MVFLTMRLHFITIPVFESAAAEAELNRFLATHRVLGVERQLVVDGPRSAWAVCVSYADHAAAASPSVTPTPTANPSATARSLRRVDYRELLSPADFEVFARLRAIRKKIAERDGLPAYAIFTTEQLAAIARGRPGSAAELGRLPGVGKARLEKYGAAFLAGVGSGSSQPEPKVPQGEGEA